MARQYGSFLCAEIAGRLGRLDEAEPFLAEGLDLNPTGVAATTVHDVGARAALARGDFDRAEAHAAEAGRSIERAMASMWVAPVYTALVVLARRRGDVAEVRALLER